MDYADFYDLAVYGNENWKGNYTPKEIACNAYNYWCDYMTSKIDQEPTQTIQIIAKLLAEDGSEECKWWLYKIAEGIGLIDMDKADYYDTDEWLKEFM